VIEGTHLYGTAYDFPNETDECSQEQGTRYEREAEQARKEEEGETPERKNHSHAAGKATTK
jgi:hypothetical protein